ncbi:hypothetical protein NP233_g9383 [Leucocoprinus birnbaumii]|uniref:Uncharacterized protein n=1 Tax=Leucocoprinus birnbaumii TaxID=56174 RepID=A0AAD5YSW8_9AGAR|nr:hypothetical protein NP233_g9383 [Leucocoprinus birnbaumii]
MLSQDRRSFLEPFGPTCLRLRSSPGGFNMKNWVFNHVVPLYEQQFPSTNSASERKQVYNWFKNHCRLMGPDPSRIASRSPAPPYSSPPPPFEEVPVNSDIEVDEGSTAAVADPITNAALSVLRIPGVRDLVAEDFKETILAEARGSPENRGNDFQFLTRWNKAVTRIISCMSSERLQEYKVKAAQLKLDSKKLPKREDVLRRQPLLPVKASENLSKLLGWKTNKQFGDAVFFLSVAYRDSQNALKTKKYLISNVEATSHSPIDFLDTYELHLADKLEAIADAWLPTSDPTAPLPLLTVENGVMPFIRRFDPEVVTAKELRTLLINYLVALWEFLFHDQNIPWNKLREHVVVSDLPAFRDFTDFNPHSMSSTDVFSLAKAFAENPKFVVFKKPDPLSGAGSQSTRGIETNSEPSTGSDDALVPVISDSPDESSCGNTPRPALANDLPAAPVQDSPSSTTTRKSSSGQKKNANSNKRGRETLSLHHLDPNPETAQLQLTTPTVTQTNEDDVARGPESSSRANTSSQTNAVGSRLPAKQKASKKRRNRQRSPSPGPSTAAANRGSASASEPPSKRTRKLTQKALAMDNSHRSVLKFVLPASYAHKRLSKLGVKHPKRCVIPCVTGQLQNHLLQACYLSPYSLSLQFLFPSILLSAVILASRRTAALV